MLDLARLLLYNRRMKFYARLECVAVEAKRKGEGLEGHAYLQLASIAPAPTLFPVPGSGFVLILIVDRTRGKLGMARSQRPDTARPDSRFNPPSIGHSSSGLSLHHIITA